MPDLENQIAEWRRQMLATGIKTPVPLEELESHLREDVERRMKSGASEAEAFTTAVEKIGGAHELKLEFAKVAGLIEQRERKRVQILVIASHCLLSLFPVPFLIFKRGNFSEMSPTEQSFCWAFVGVMILLVCAGQLGQRLFPTILSQRARDGIGVLGGLLFVLWLTFCGLVLLPRFDFTLGQILVAMLWVVLIPFGFFMALLAGLEKAAQKITSKVTEAT